MGDPIPSQPMSGFATIREVHAVQDALLKEMRAMEERLTAKIEEANIHHEDTHTLMRRAADDRHRIIDDFIEAQLMASKIREGKELGRSGLIGQTISVLRIANEFRWLIAILLALIIFGGFGTHIDWSTP